MVDVVGQRTLNDLLRERSQMHPERRALSVEAADGTVSHRTYEELQVQVSSVADGLRALGVDKGDAVLVHLPNCVEIVVAWFALARLGAVMVPSNPQHTVREISYVARMADVKVAFVRPDDAHEVRVSAQLPKAKIVVVGGVVEDYASYQSLRNATPGESPEAVASEDVVEMIFTSGTTADPKGVLLTHANCLRSGEQIAKSLVLTPEDCCLTSLPVFHVNAQSTVLAAMSVGARFVLLEKYSASQFVDRLIHHGATITSLVGTQVRTLLRQVPTPRDSAHGLRHVFYAINVTDAEYHGFEERFGVRLLNGYGLSEAMMAVTIAPAYGERRWPSVGLPLIDREVRIVDEEGQVCAAGEIGEITVGGVPGRTLMKGYHDNPEATAAALRDGWLRTGDSGYADPDGYIYFVDRKKDMIKRSGENVSASEVETVLMEHPDILEAAVIGVPDPIWDEAILAYVALSVPATPEAIIEFCRHHLAPYKVPSFVEILSELPKTSIGKIEKKALRAVVDATHAPSGGDR